MLAPFLTAEKKAIVFGPRDCGEIVRGKLGCVLPVHHEGDPGVLRWLEAQRVHGVQPRSRSRIETSAASALSGTVKPAVRRPFGVSTKTWRRRCGICSPLRSRQRARVAAGSKIIHRLECKPKPGGSD